MTESSSRKQRVPGQLAAKHYVVSGMVQGVGYRFFVQRAAAQCGVSGWVRNRSDGNVEAYAIGTTEQLRDFRAALQRGPRMASVSAVREEEAEVDKEHIGDFSIEHGW